MYCITQQITFYHINIYNMIGPADIILYRCIHAVYANYVQVWLCHVEVATWWYVLHFLNYRLIWST